MTLEFIDWLSSDGGIQESVRRKIPRYIRRHKWEFPQRTTYVFTDPHADAEALRKSFEHCEDTSAVHVIVGDLFDKGPSNLDLFNTIEDLMGEREIHLLCGNHDVRMKLALSLWDNHEKQMQKRGRSDYEKIFSQKRMEGRISPLLKETGGIENAQRMFLEKEGRYSWVFSEMDLMYRAGSFLFVHAGIDDEVASELRNDGIRKINRRFARKWDKPKNVYRMYYGPYGNCFRTKYRLDEDKDDLDFTTQGQRDLHSAGLHAIVHGHDSGAEGHQLHLYNEVLNLICDVTIDQGSRRKEDIAGKGWGALVIRPEGIIEAMSADYPKGEPSVIRVLDFNKYT